MKLIAGKKSKVRLSEPAGNFFGRAHPEANTLSHHLQIVRRQII
jgi:hypothetical protein